MCGCFGNMCTCIYCVLYCLYCVFVLFRLSMWLIFVCTSVRTTATTENSIAVNNNNNNNNNNIRMCRSQWPCGLRSRSAAAHLLGLRVRIPPGAWMSVCCERCVLSDRGVLCRADDSSRGILPTVVCPMSVISKLRKGRPWPGIGSKRHRYIYKIMWLSSRTVCFWSGRWLLNSNL